MIALKRAYQPFARADGYRVLVDRLWPRGVRKADAHIDVWLKDIAPSTELRQWFGHEPKRWLEFRLRYRKELRSESAKSLLDDLAKRVRTGTVTLVYAAHDEVHNGAIVLQGICERRARGGKAKHHARRAA